MIKTPSCLLMAVQQDYHINEVISCCKAKSDLAFGIVAEREDSLSLKPY